MENKLVVARGRGWIGETGMIVVEGILSGDGTILYLDCGGGYKSIHRIKLQRTTKTQMHDYKNW